MGCGMGYGMGVWGVSLAKQNPRDEPRQGAAGRSRDSRRSCPWNFSGAAGGDGSRLREKLPKPSPGGKRGAGDRSSSFGVSSWRSWGESRPIPVCWGRFPPIHSVPSGQRSRGRPGSLGMGFMGFVLPLSCQQWDKHGIVLGGDTRGLQTPWNCRKNGTGIPKAPGMGHESSRSVGRCSDAPNTSMVQKSTKPNPELTGKTQRRQETPKGEESPPGIWIPVGI